MQGLDGGFENINDLNSMNSNEAINVPDGKAWQLEIKTKHGCMMNIRVLEEVDKPDLSEGTKVIDST